MRLNQLPTVLDDLTYPLSANELSAALAGRTLDHPAGQEPVSAVVERCGSDAMESSDDAWLSMVASVDEDAVGRKFYSDRDPPCDSNEFDAVSF
jgi:hypothetical protein